MKLFNSVYGQGKFLNKVKDVFRLVSIMATKEILKIDTSGYKMLYIDYFDKDEVKTFIVGFDIDFPKHGDIEEVCREPNRQKRLIELRKMGYL